MRARFLLLPTTTLIINLIIYSIHSKIIQISNSKPRRDVNNNIINAHSGNIVFVDSTYFLYGENYGNGSNYIVPNNTKIPKLVVYTSPDMLTWTFKGFLHNNSIDQTKWWQHSGKWPHFPNGTWWSPSAMFDKKSKSFILYFGASTGECCDAYFGIAQSFDGVHFQLITLNETPSQGASVDGSSIFIDNDGKGYVCYTAMGVPGMDGHVVAIVCYNKYRFHLKNHIHIIKIPQLTKLQYYNRMN